MKESAGIVIRLRGSKLLLCRPAGSQGFYGSINTWGPPKGGIDPGETIIDAAIRETREEIGIKIKKNQIVNLDKPILVNYTNKGSSIYKRVYLFLVDIESVDQIGLSSEIVPNSFLQIEEIDKAYFMNKSEATENIFHRFKSILDLI